LNTSIIAAYQEILKAAKGGNTKKIEAAIDDFCIPFQLVTSLLVTIILWWACMFSPQNFGFDVSPNVRYAWVASEFFLYIGIGIYIGFFARKRIERYLRRKYLK